MGYFRYPFALLTLNIGDMYRVPAAFIVWCVLLAFVVLAVAWFIHRLLGRAQAMRRRRIYDRSLIFVLKDFVRFCYQEYKTATVSLRALDMRRREEVVRNFTVSGSPDYLSKLGFILFQSSDAFLFETDTLKTSSTLFSLRDQIISQQEHIGRFIQYASDEYRSQEKVYDDNFYSLRLLYDKLRLYTDTVSDIRTAEWMDAYFRVFDDYVTHGRSRDMSVSHPEVVLKVLRISYGYRDVAFAVEAIEHGLRCDIAYTHILTMDEALAAQLKQFAYSHRLAYKMVTLIITRMDVPPKASAGSSDILRDLFMVSARTRSTARNTHKATAGVARARKIPGWRGLFARISGFVLIMCGVLLFADTLLCGLPRFSFSNLFTRSGDTLCLPKGEAFMKGMDLSKYQGDAAKDGVAGDVDFIICKATEGSDYIDPDFSTHWNFMRRMCTVRGVYHFYYDTGDPEQQAQHFIEVVREFGVGDVPIVAIEYGSITGAASAATLQADLLRFLAYTERVSGRKPMIYTNLRFADVYLSNPAFGDYPLWLADYSGAASPMLPEAWKDKGFTLWQRRGSYTDPAPAGDLDIFNGDSAALQAFAGGSLF